MADGSRPPAGAHRDTLTHLKDRVSTLMAGVRETFDSHEQDSARRWIVEAKQIEDICDEKIQAIVQAAEGDVMAPAYVLAYRYVKRITSHVRNIASSVVQPIHKLDFTSKITAEEDESQE